MATLKVLGISGSLRKGSFNTAALRAARELAPAGMEIDIFDLSPIPIYNGDVEDQGFPEPVKRLHEKIAAANAILIASPEYNYSMSGVIKNAIDWASRPSGKSVLNGKTVALMGASQGIFGTARAQYHLRQCFIFFDAFVLNKPEVMIGKAQEKFDAQGKLTDEKTREMIGKLLTALVAKIG